MRERADATGSADGATGFLIEARRYDDGAALEAAKRDRTDDESTEIVAVGSSGLEDERAATGAA